jgi:hypothetical protein
MNGESRSLQDLLRIWRTGEERLYPVVLIEPGLYQDYLTLVRAIADGLADIREPTALALSYEREGSWLQEIQEEFLETIDPLRRPLLDFQLAKDAAYHLRYQEIMESLQKEEIRRRIALAQETEEEWVVLSRREAPCGLETLFSCLEMHLESGAGLYYYADIDLERGMIYGLDVLRLDPETGEPVIDSTSREGSRIFSSLDELTEETKRLRSLYSRRRDERFTR